MYLAVETGGSSRSEVFSTQDRAMRALCLWIDEADLWDHDDREVREEFDTYFYSDRWMAAFRVWETWEAMHSGNLWFEVKERVIDQ